MLRSKLTIFVAVACLAVFMILPPPAGVIADPPLTPRSIADGPELSDGDPKAPDGWVMWEQAVAEYIGWWHDDAIYSYEARSFRYPLPGGDDGDKLRGFVKTNARALALFRQGVAAGRVRVPPSHSKSKGPSLSELHKLVDLLTLHAKIERADGRWGPAIEDLVTLARAGHRVTDGAEDLLTVMWGGALESIGVDCVAQASVDPRVSEAALMAAIHAVEPDLRAERSDWVGHALTRMIDEADSQIVNARKHQKITDKKLDEIGQANPDAAGAIRSLVGDALAPYRDVLAAADRIQKDAGIAVELGDPDAVKRELRRTGDMIAAAASQNWPKAKDRLDEIVKRARAGADEVDDAIDAFDEAVKTAGDGKLPHDVAKALADRLRNAIGRRYVALTADTLVTGQSVDRGSLLTCRVALVRIALEVYRRRHGRLPDSLNQLATDNILASVPGDPFGDGPLRYDAKRGVIWSRGGDGIDDDGTGEVGENPRGEPDAVFPAIPAVDSASGRK